MPRSVFFSFAYDDVKNFKVNVVRQNWVTKNRDETFVDGSLWEKAKTKGDVAIRRLIDRGLSGTSVTVVLVGESTASRRWVNYELVRSFERGNGILAVHINRIKGISGLTARGENPLERLRMNVSDDVKRVSFEKLTRYRWEEFEDLSEINNKLSNSLHFSGGWFGDGGHSYRFSEKFKTYCWSNDDGNRNFQEWVEKAALQVGR